LYPLPFPYQHSSDTPSFAFDFQLIFDPDISLLLIGHTRISLTPLSFWSFDVSVEIQLEGS